MKWINWPAILVIGISISPALSQNRKSATELDAAALMAYRAKDYKQFVLDEQQALQLDPCNPRILYNLACGEALQDRADEAVQILDQLADRKLDLGEEQDSDFAAIRSTPQWHGLQEKLAKLRQPVVHSRMAFALSDPNLMAAGMAVDPRTGDAYIASVRERKIVRRTRAGTVSDFIREGQDGFLAGASVAIDAGRGLLYATTAAVPYMLGYRAADSGQSGVFAFQLRSGRLARKLMLPADGKRHFLNAMAIDRAGNVYISDSGTPGVYLLGRGSDRLQPFLAPNVFRSTQGLALSRNEKILYLADWSDGVWAIELASKQRHRLAAPPEAFLGGLDGLSRAGHDLVALQIGVAPQRVLRLRLDRRGRQITEVEVLELNHPNYAGPIQGAVAGRSFFYVANSQLALGNPRTGAFAAERARPTVVLRLPL